MQRVRIYDNISNETLAQPSLEAGPDLQQHIDDYIGTVIKTDPNNHYLRDADISWAILTSTHSKPIT